MYLTSGLNISQNDVNVWEMVKIFLKLLIYLEFEKRHKYVVIKLKILNMA